MTKQLMVGLSHLILGGLVGSALVWATPAMARPPLDLVTGEGTVPQLKEDGDRYMTLGFNTLAVEAYRSAIEFEDSTNMPMSQWDPDVPFNLGLIYSGQGDLRAARDAFERAVTANPESFKAHYQLGLTEFRLGNFEAAREELELLATSTTDPAMEAHLEALIDELPDPGRTVSRSADPSRLSRDDNDFESVAPAATSESVAPSTTGNAIPESTSTDSTAPTPTFQEDPSFIERLQDRDFD